MATNTTNYNLIKPTDNEFAEISVINENMDIIDTGMKNLDNLKEGLIKSATEKTALVDADALPVVDSADSSKTKKLSFANLKILLKTIFATTEDISALNTSLSNTIKKDGSVQMTGVLKTKGASILDSGISQINMDNAEIITRKDASGMHYTFVVNNAYIVNNVWYRKDVGTASRLSIVDNNLYFYTAITGVKDSVISWVDVSPLLKTGGTLVGSLTIDNYGMLLLRGSGKTGLLNATANDVQLDILNEVGGNVDYSNGRYLSLRGLAYGDVDSLVVSKIVNGITTPYKVYHEANITVSTVAPGSALVEGAQHQVY